MPIYEYACPTCGQDFEKLVRLSDPTPACPNCGGADATKKVSAASFLLKGGGWYKDHYGLKKSSGGSSDGSSSGSSGSSGGSSGSSSGGSSSGSSGSSASAP